MLEGGVVSRGLSIVVWPRETGGGGGGCYICLLWDMRLRGVNSLNSL